MFNDTGNIGELLRKVREAVFIIGIVLAVIVVIAGIYLARGLDPMVFSLFTCSTVILYVLVVTYRASSCLDLV